MNGAGTYMDGFHANDTEKDVSECDHSSVKGTIPSDKPPANKDSGRRANAVGSDTTKIQSYKVGLAKLSRPPLLLKGLVNGKCIRVMLDSGASHSFCATRLASDESQRPAELMSATMVDGTPLKIGKPERLTLAMGPLRWTHEFFPT